LFKETGPGGSAYDTSPGIQEQLELGQEKTDGNDSYANDKDAENKQYPI
jgi:hypothetical protein